MGPPQTPSPSLIRHQKPASVPRMTDSRARPVEACPSAAGRSVGKPLAGPVSLQIPEETAFLC